MPNPMRMFERVLLSQVICLTAVTVALFVWLQTSHGTSRAARAEAIAGLKRLDGQLHRALPQSMTYAAHRRSQDRAAAEETLRAAVEEAGRLRALLPRLERTLEALSARAASIGRLFPTLEEDGAGPATMAALEKEFAWVLDETARLEETAMAAAEDLQAWHIQVMSAAWIGALLLFLVLAVVARYQYQAATRRETQTWSEFLHRAAAAVEEGGGVQQTAADPPLPAAGTLVLAISRAQAARVALGADLHREQTRGAVLFNLTRRLDLAESENDVCDAVLTASRVLLPQHEPLLMMADNSRASLEVAAGTAQRLCEACSPLACPAVRWGQAYVSAPGSGMDRCPRLCVDHPAVVTCVALSARGNSLGVVQLAGPALEHRQAELLTTAVVLIGARLGVVRAMEEREVQATTDVLTGLANRRAMNDALRRLAAAGTRFAVVAADLDHFKRLNDTYGHEVGDQCLKAFAGVLREACRTHDLPCRPGGEEFTLVLPGSDMAGGQAVAERIQRLLAAACERRGMAFTTSLGVAACAGEGEQAADVLRRADAALYAAKAAGRDRIVVDGTPAPGNGHDPAAGVVCAST
ncbi:MAG: GGDEF domain-containing protein [Deltaproteobacteria bacterium]|nr:GGDEF domain-containing protein [Deltaproteobacteria bacterium]